MVVSDLVVEEVERFFREEVSREAGYLSRRFIETLAQRIVHREITVRKITELQGTIKQKDLENLAALRHLRLMHLVSFDEDYRKAHVKEYVTPKEFVKLFNMEPYPTNY